MVDGVQNLLPAGLGRRFQLEYSTLGDAYKDSELDPDTGLGIFRLSSIPVDARRAERGFARDHRLVGRAAATPHYSAVGRAARRVSAADATSTPERRLRGRRGGLLRQRGFVAGAAARAALHPGGRRRAGQRPPWRPPCACCVRRSTLAARCRSRRRGARDRSLARIVAARRWPADRRRRAGQRPALRQRACSTVMRGGIPARGLPDQPRRLCPLLAAPATDALCERQRRPGGSFAGRDPARRSCWRGARARRDPDLERLAHEYLPLTFSRRHGDPSRPWNRFDDRDAATSSGAACWTTRATGATCSRTGRRWRVVSRLRR